MKDLHSERVKTCKEILLYAAYFKDCNQNEKYYIIKKDRQFPNMMTSAVNLANMFLAGRLGYHNGLDEALRRCRNVISKDTIKSYRDMLIINDFRRGMDVKSLSEKYGLSTVTINTKVGC